MISTCCNLYFYYNFIVHGGIRHLEIKLHIKWLMIVVHGGIRHLETLTLRVPTSPRVHGGIRHLEKNIVVTYWI